MPILPFTIGDLRFVHTEGDDALDKAMRLIWAQRSEASAHRWQGEEWSQCDCPGTNILFAVSSIAHPTVPSDPFALYGVLPIGSDPNVIKAIPAPMFKGIVEDVRPPDEGGVPPDRAETFWKSLFSVLEKFLDVTLARDDGTALDLEHWYWPDCTQPGHPKQHEWIQVDRYFNLYSNKEFVTVDGRLDRMNKATRP